MNQGTYKTNSGLDRKIRTTKGWELYVRRKDGSGEWIKMKDLKYSYPVPLADYSVVNKLQDEPAFDWWVPYTLKKRITIISKIKYKFWKKTHISEIQIPRKVKEKKAIDIENGNKLWKESWVMEKTNNMCAFEHYEGNTSELVAYEEITVHLIFDVKLSENFRRKARFIADGHLVETPASIKYSTVVSRDSVRILLLAAALNDLDVMGTDVQNAFLSADNIEKH